jgi:hypothetical protein
LDKDGGGNSRAVREFWGKVEKALVFRAGACYTGHVLWDELVISSQDIEQFRKEADGEEGKTKR